MIALTKSRRVQFRKNGLNYPGFKSFTGSWDEFSTSGLCTFTGSIDIMNHHTNPSTVDNRKNRTGWMFGTEIEILVQDDNENYVKPKILPKLYIKNSNPYNPETRILTLNVSCVLNLLTEYSLDHWKNPEKDPNDTEEPEIDEWWSEWDKKGETTVAQIVSKIFQKLEINMNSGQGLPSTKVLLPWSPSGSLITSCGDLVFKSGTPSQLYSDENGNINISAIDVLNPPLDLYVKIGLHEKFYQPTGTDSPLSELIVTGEIPEIVENVDDLITDDPEKGFCTYREEKGPDYAIGGTSGAETTLATEETCERIILGAGRMIKIVTTKRYERLGLLFPDAPLNKTLMVKALEKVQRQEFEVDKENRLTFEETTIKEPWGKIFGAWYSNHLDWFITNAPANTSEGGPISGFADEARYSTAIAESRRETKDYIYNQDKTLRKTEQKVYEPVSKILTSFNGDGFNTGFNPQTMMSEKHIEEWVRYRKNERHTKASSVTMEAKYSSIIEASDSYLRETHLKQVGAANADTATILVNKFERNPAVPSSTVISSKRVDKNFFLLRQRVALVSDIDKGQQALSRTGEAAPPPTENIPNNEAKEEGESEPEYKNKIVVDRHAWEFPYPNKYKPPREIVSLGVLANVSILRKLGEILYFMRQGKSFSYELVLPLNQYWIETNFKPLQRIDVDEPENKLIYIGCGFNIELRDTESLVLCQLYWLGFK